MSTSGSIDFQMTARSLARFAMQELGVIDSLHTPSAEDSRDVVLRLNMMLKQWQQTGPNLWRQTVGTATLVADTASYVLSPKPYRVHEARFRSTAGRDIPMFELTRQEYFDLPLKTSTGVPTNYYVDYQRATATLYVWPVPVSDLGTIQYTYQRTIEDVDGLDEELDIPQEWFETVGVNLADRCQKMFGVNDQDLTGRAALLHRQAKDADREAIVRFVPERRR